MKSIQSRDNPLVKRLRALNGSARERRKLGQTVLDGEHLISAALDADVALDAVVVSQNAVDRGQIDAVLERLGEGAPVSLLPDVLFAQISPVSTPSGLLAVMPVPPAPPSLPVAGDVLVLDGVQDAGNLGTLMRTAAAAGIGQVVLSAGCAQVWSPKVLRAAMGAHFVMCVHEQVDLAVWLDSYRGPRYATALSPDCVDLYACDLREAGAWLFGAEGAGLSEAVLAGATERLRIPMPGQVESLNVSAAAAICLFEQLRQRRP